MNRKAPMSKEGRTDKNECKTCEIRELCVWSNI